MRYEWIDGIFLIYFCSFGGDRIGAGIPVRGRHLADGAHGLHAQLVDRLGAFSLLRRHLSVLQVFYGRNPSFMAGILLLWPESFENHLIGPARGTLPLGRRPHPPSDQPHAYNT